VPGEQILRDQKCAQGRFRRGDKIKGSTCTAADDGFRVAR